MKSALEIWDKEEAVDDAKGALDVWGEPSTTTPKSTPLSPAEEKQFQSAYKKFSTETGLNVDPDDPLHFYDYRGLWKEEGGFHPDKAGHLSSKYKLPGHPNLLPEKPSFLEETGKGLATWLEPFRPTKKPVPSDVIGALKTLGQTLIKVPKEMGIAALKAHLGAEGASVVNKGWMERTLADASVSSDAFVKDILGKYKETRIAPGIPIKITDIAELPRNIAYSLTSMGTGLAVGIPIGLAPIPGARAAAWAVGTAASGKAAYEMSTYEIMQEYLEAMNEKEIEETGKPLTPEKEAQLKKDFNSEATKYGLWEAIPEALSNLAFAKILTTPLTKIVGKSLAGRITGKMAAIYGEELLTETITQKGQVPIEQRAGLREGEGITWGQAFKEIAPQTFLLSTILGGTGAAAVKATEKIRASLKREKGLTPEELEAKILERQEESKEEAPPPKIPPEAPEKPLIAPKAPEAIPKVEPVPPVGEAPLIEEAKKYKTAEEFIKANTDAYHGTPKDLVGEFRVSVSGVMGKGVYLHESSETARVASAMQSDGNILDQVAYPIKILTDKIYQFDEGGYPDESLIQKIKKQGYDGIRTKDGEIIIFDPKKVKHKQQLTDIWKQAQEKALPVEISEAFRGRLKEIQKTFKAEKTRTKKEIKAVQEEIIGKLEESGLEAVDRAKFIRAIKNVQTQEQLVKALPEIIARVVKLEIAAKKRESSVKIKKELKTTKPLKVGQKRVGKFDYDTNKMFDALRGYNKLVQEEAQAEFDKFPEEVATEVDLIKKRFLSLRANGAAASAEIHEQVLADIVRIKKLGKEAKDEATLEKLLNRQERVDSALADVGRMRADKKTIKTKIGNAYHRGFSNIYSMLNSIGGKAFAETYDLELGENRRNTATYGETLKITREASEIYGEKNVMRLFEAMSKMDYQITDMDGLTTELSKLELVDIYNSLKNDKKRQDYYGAFGEDQVETLMRKLTPQDEAFGDSLQEAIQDYREILNKRNIEITGRDLGFVENYWPATSEYQVSVLDDLRMQGETPSALKERARAKVIPIPKNAWYKAQRHISQAEHVDNLSRKYETLRRLFTDRKVKHAIIQKFGENVYGTLMAQIDNASLNKQSERIDAISGAFQKAINNWVTAKIALNPSTFVRQLMSVGNYIELMSPTEWTKGFFEGILSPKQTFDYMWKNAPFLEARFNRGYSEALKEAIKGAESVSVNRKVWTKMLTALVRSGDITAIIYGGFPLVRSELAKGKSMKEAIDTFESATLKAQQSGLSTSISQFQNSRNPFTRLFLAFKNTVNQYLRKMGDATISYYNKDISAAQYAKTMAIYAVIQPIMYVSAGHITKLAFSSLGRLVGIRGDEEDFEDLLERFLNDIMVQLVVSPVNAIPLVNDAVRAAMRKLTGQKVYQVISYPWLEDLERGMKAMMKKTITGGDYLKIASSILEPTTGAPVGVIIRLYEMFTGKKIGGKGAKSALEIWAEPSKTKGRGVSGALGIWSE